MNNLTPRQRKGLQTKKRILDIALTLFSEKGYENVTIDEIVQEANTSKGAFYNHFKSKDELFIEKFKEIDRFYADFLEDMSDAESSRDKLIQLVQAQMILIKEKLGKEIMSTIYMNAISHKPSYTLANKERPLYQIVESLIKQGVTDGEFKGDLSVKEITLLITRTMRGTIYDWCLFSDDFDLVQEGNKAIIVVLDGLRNWR